MAKASPIIRAFNAGVFSVLMEGRTDLDRYPVSLRQGFNGLALQQGPFMARPGTEFRQPLRNESGKGILVPFEFNKEQALMLEFNDGKVRFHDDEGLLTYDPVAITALGTSGGFLQITSTTLGASVGGSVELVGFSGVSGLSYLVGVITAKVGNVYTLNIAYSGSTTPTGAETASLVYEIAHPYSTESELLKVRYAQLVDLVYLWNGGRVRSLCRYGVYDWRFSEVKMLDGPFMPEDDTGTTFSVSATGNAATNSTGTSISSYAGTPSNAFDEDTSTYWVSGTNQIGDLIFTPTTPFVATGYYYSSPKQSTETSYTAKNHMPMSWEFQGWDGSVWVVLDEQDDFELLDGHRTPYIELNNSVAYSKYRIYIKGLNQSGSIAPWVTALVISSDAAASINITASSTTGINNGEGFKSTDVGRLIRLKSNDGFWRWGEITAFSSTTVVTVKLNSPLPNTARISHWRLGYWSDTTGWPTVGLFFDDRLWLAGSADAPDLVAWTATGAYKTSQLTMSPTDPDGTVAADNGGSVRLNSAKLGAVQWMETDEKGLMLGTLNGEWVISQITSQSALSTTNLRARNTTRRGSAAINAIKAGNQVIFAQRGKRSIFEMAYNYEVDGYRAPSMSVYASHMFTKNKTIEQMAYCADPNSIVWIRRSNGTLVSLTYNREENVIGWFEHDVGGTVEWIAAMPAPEAARDDLWMIVNRTINGATHRYVERLKPFWDFGNEITDAWYLDCALAFDSATALTRVYGLGHLEGEEVYALVDGVKDGPFTVTSGYIDLTVGGKVGVIGKGFEALGETARIEAGAADGTAQGKLKRVPSVVAYMWDSAGGEYGVYNLDKTNEDGSVGGVVWEPIPYTETPFDEVEAAALHTEEVEVPLDQNYNRAGTVYFRKPKDSPLPFNIIRLCPSVLTQDAQ